MYCFARFVFNGGEHYITNCGFFNKRYPKHPDYKSNFGSAKIASESGFVGRQIYGVG